jgi:hypothetical protein
LINRDGWETKPFTGGDETTAAAESKAAALEKLSSGSGVYVLQRRKGSQGVRARAYIGHGERK